MRTVLIGAGYRGKALLRLMRGIPFFDIVGIADPALLSGSEEPSPATNRSKSEAPTIYAEGPEDYRRMLAEQKPELAVICSPWHCHIPQALDCLKAGCHVALEIRGGIEEGEYEPLKAFPGKVFPLENLIFRKDIMAVKNMAAAGLFGEIVYMRGGYHHDLRDIIVEKPYEEWRSLIYAQKNGDIYPTHSMAPLCFIGGIRSITELSSFASKPAGLNAKFGTPRSAVAMGDIVKTIMRTPDGTLLSIEHDTTLPRPKSFGIVVQGTKGLWEEDARRIYIENRSPEEKWESDAPYIEEYLDPAWKRWGAEAEKADSHHGGMDYIMLKAIEADLLGDTPYPVSVEDLALWASITPLSCRSIAEHRTINLK